MLLCWGKSGHPHLLGILPDFKYWCLSLSQQHFKFVFVFIYIYMQFWALCIDYCGIYVWLCVPFQIAAEWTQIFLHMTDGRCVSDFTGIRTRAMVALAVSCPEPVSSFPCAVFFSLCRIYGKTEVDFVLCWRIYRFVKEGEYGVIILVLSPTTNGGQIHLIFVTVLLTPWQS